MRKKKKALIYMLFARDKLRSGYPLWFPWFILLRYASQPASL